MRGVAIVCCLLFIRRSAVAGLTSDDLTTLDSIMRTTIRGPAVATAVRLAFHDCVGGCDGCLNINNVDNAGLEDLVESLEVLYTDNNLSSLLSRADFWAYAGFYSVNKAIERTNDDCTEDVCTVSALSWTFQYGRTDCATSPYTDVDVELPGPHLTYDELTSFYSERFGFDAKEAVAIMGAHTLGGADVDNSGFKGAWVSGGARFFNNDYYTVMMKTGWENRNVGSDEDPKWQWASTAGFMLNSDMCLLKDLQMDENGENSLGYDDLGSSEGAKYVEQFAEDQDHWLAKFAATFTKMQANGYDSLTDVA